MTGSELRIAGVAVRIGAAELVRDVTVHCPAGSFVGLLGPNGSGKSSLLRTVYRALTPDTGSVFLDDGDLRAMPARQAARCVAVLAQEPGHEVGFTVGEMVAAGRTPHHGVFARFGGDDREVVTGAIATVGLTGHEHRAFGALFIAFGGLLAIFRRP